MRTRVLEPELMDDPALARPELERALRGLRRLNAVSLAPSVLWREVGRAAMAKGGELRVLDVACASGDWLIWAARRAGRAGMSVRFSGCDINGAALEMGRDAARRAGVDVVLFTHDAVRSELAGTYDVCVCSLFLHHLGEREAVSVVQHMARAARRVVINDLVRSRAGLCAVWTASRVLSASGVVHTDGPRSVRAAFARTEMQALCEEAGMRGVRIGFGGFGRMLVTGEGSA